MLLRWELLWLSDELLVTRQSRKETNDLLRMCYVSRTLRYCRKHS